MAVVAAGRLVARLVALRRLAWRVAAASDRGEPPVVEAATLKILGTEFEGHVANVARSVFGVEPDPTSDAALPRLLAQAVVASPGFTIRGGSTEVLLGIVAKAETRA
jgi:alkylation response protein AidB-like acyl-CoA dehydrogenase